MSGNKVLELKNISKSFGTRKIIDKLNLSLDKGDILSIIGPSGAGKTTLLRLIAGLESADSGKFLHNGKEFDPTDRNNHLVGMVFQDYNLFPNLSVMDNITLAPIMVNKMSKAEAENRTDQLIDTECFCTNRAGEEYSIEEADDAAEDTGGGHQESAGDQGIFCDGR